MTFRYGRDLCRIAVAFAGFAGVVAFPLQASAQTPEPTTTTVQASPASAMVGQQVVLSSMVSCPGFVPGGLGVTFFDGEDLLATVPLDASGNASETTTFSTAGSHTITAAYNGDANCAASNSVTTVQVTTASPVPPAPPTPSLGGGLINFINGDVTIERS